MEKRPTTNANVRKLHPWHTQQALQLITFPLRTAVLYFSWHSGQWMNATSLLAERFQ
jgi:hypothetical protein